MSSEHLTIFVCSDFHAFDGSAIKETEPSWFNIQSSGSGSICPVAQLLDYIEEKRLRADLSVFCGDLGDKALPVATTVTSSY